MKEKNGITDHQINAYIDDELDFQERAAVLVKAKQCKQADSRLTEYHKLKELVQHSYASVPKPQNFSNVSDQFKRPVPQMQNRLYLSILLLVVGFIGGSAVNAYWSTPVNSSLDFTAADNQHQQSSVPTQYLLHLASDDFAKMDAALNRAEDLLRTAKSEHDLKIEIIANSSGVNLFREAGSPFKSRITALASKGVVFAACARTIERLRDENDSILLFPEVDQQQTAMQRVVNGLNNGAIYESI